MNKHSIIENRRARFDYELENEIEAGLVLKGWEVASIRRGRVQITGAHALVQNSEVFLLGSTITPLETTANHTKPSSDRSRKLLLSRSEIRKLHGKCKERGFTLIPIRLYWKKNRVKCLIALARGKSKFDKRATLKEREWKREQARWKKTAV